jgi:hypothetical protein
MRAALLAWMVSALRSWVPSTSSPPELETAAASSGLAAIPPRPTKSGTRSRADAATASAGCSPGDRPPLRGPPARPIVLLRWPSLSAHASFDCARPASSPSTDGVLDGQAGKLPEAMPGYATQHRFALSTTAIELRRCGGGRGPALVRECRRSLHTAEVACGPVGHQALLCCGQSKSSQCIG